MINIVQRIFRAAAPPRNTGLRLADPRLLLPFVALLSSPVEARSLPVLCDASGFCEARPDARRPPGAPDRDARPFGGSLGRPCAYRQRFTPEGTRRVRVCF